MAEKSQTKAAAAMADDKKRAIETAMQQIERTYGKGSIMRFGDNTVSNVEAISTGSLALDLALGIGGLPKGRIIEIYGPESSGKTTLALHIVAQAQKRGGEVAFVDAEHALDPDYAARIGVDIDSMLVSQPDTGEQALEITDAASPGLALGHALGRIGCFLAGCCWGIPAPEPWGIALPQALAAPRGVPLLPVPLYEAAGNALLCAGLLLYRKKKPRRTPGSSTGLYLSAYAVLRFLLEFLRGDEARGRWGALSAGQWNALAALLVGLWLLVRIVEIEIRLDGASVSAEARLLCGLAALRAGARLYRDEKGSLRAEARVLGKPLTRQQLAAHRQRRKELPGGAVSRALKRLHPEVAALSLRVRIGVPGDAAGTAKLHGLCAALLGLLRAWAERHAARAAHEPFRVRSEADFSRSVWEARGQCILWIKMGNLLSAGLCLAAEALRGRKLRRKKGTYKEAESNGASD